MTKPDITYKLINNNNSAQLIAHSVAGLKFLSDHLPSGRCWAPHLRTDHGTGYVQIAQGRGLTVTYEA